MFRILIGLVLLIIGFFVMCAAIAGTHTGLPTNLLEIDTWVLWGMFLVPYALGLWLLLGKSVKRLFR